MGVLAYKRGGCGCGVCAGVRAQAKLVPDMEEKETGAAWVVLCGCCMKTERVECVREGADACVR